MFWSKKFIIWTIVGMECESGQKKFVVLCFRVCVSKRCWNNWAVGVDLWLVHEWTRRPEYQIPTYLYTLTLPPCKLYTSLYTNNRLLLFFLWKYDNTLESLVIPTPSSFSYDIIKLNTFNFVVLVIELLEKDVFCWYRRTLLNFLLS